MEKEESLDFQNAFDVLKAEEIKFTDEEVNYAYCKPISMKFSKYIECSLLSIILCKFEAN